MPANPPHDRGTIRFQPLPYGQPAPELALLGGHKGVTSITRIWNDGDHERCRLCETCSAVSTDKGDAFCNVLTTAKVTEESAPLYSLRGVILDAPSDLGDLGGLRITFPL